MASRPGPPFVVVLSIIPSAGEGTTYAALDAGRAILGENERGAPRVE
jgi:hypothetical protein